MDGIRFVPLTNDQKHRLDAHGNRIWTEQEIRTIKSNLVTHDYIRTVLSRRCGVKDCRFVIKSTKESFALPHFSDVCEVCYHMWYALKSPALKNMDYFVQLHDKWQKDIDDSQRKRDRLGL